MVLNLELKPYKNGNQDEMQFIYNLKKEVYQKYVENIFGAWNEENQKKLFNIEIGNICIKKEFRNKGIGTAVLRENEKIKRINSKISLRLNSKNNSDIN